MLVTLITHPRTRMVEKGHCRALGPAGRDDAHGAQRVHPVRQLRRWLSEKRHPLLLQHREVGVPFCVVRSSTRQRRTAF